MSLEVVSVNDQMISVIGKENIGEPWLLSVIYASPKAHLREELWCCIRDLGRVVNIPWLLIEDTNQPLDQCDKQGGKLVNQAQTRKLRTMVDSCGFLDLGFQGPKYT